MVGITDDLTTADKSSIVAAINELVKRTVKYFDPDNKDFSIDTVFDDDPVNVDFEIGYQTKTAVPNSTVGGTGYNADMMALGGQIPLPTPDPDNGDTDSTLWKQNYGDSNVTQQLLGWQSRPLYYNGQTGVRRWLELYDDVHIFKTETVLSRAIGGTTEVFGAQSIVGKTLLYDYSGTIAVSSGGQKYETICISPIGSDEPTLLTPASSTYATLPQTVTDALILYGRTPAIDDYTRVMADEAAVPAGHTTERYITSIDDSGNIVWGNYIVINTSDYQEQSSSTDAGKILTAGATDGTFGTPIDPSAFGNTNTENYFETETQVGYYTRADGKKKPVYKTYFSGTIVTNIYAIQYNALIDINSGIVETLLSSTGGCQTGLSNSPYYDINNTVFSGVGIDAHAFAVRQQNTGIAFLSSTGGYSGTGYNNYRIWCSYTKTTDAWE
jgi:hypothetical protein